MERVTQTVILTINVTYNLLPMYICNFRTNITIFHQLSPFLLLVVWCEWTSK